MFLCSLIGASSAANTYNITDNSYSNYFNSTGYITNANVKAGDTLDLSGTIKNKNMYINRPLNITSTHKTAQILNGTITILTNGSGTNITNLKINNSNKDGIGIFLYETENNTIKGNQIHCNGPTGFGIALTRSHHNDILKNTVITTQRLDSTQTHSALVLGESNYNIIEGNTVKSDGASGIYLSIYSGGLFESNGPSYHNDIINNTVVGVDTPWCYAIQMMGSYNRAINNKIVSQSFPEKRSSYGIGAYRGISSESEGGNTIIGNTISATYCGIFATSNSTISGNKISNYKDRNTASYSNINGISAGPNCTIANNIINMTNGYGIYITGSNCNLTGNKIISTSSQESICLYGAINNITITKNTINSKSTGILLKKQSSTKQPTQNTINNNHITSSSTYAINTAEGTKNTITNNYLVSDNNKKLGNSAISSGTSNTVNSNTPSTVIVTPNSGYYKNTIKVTLINKNGNIYYTLNGTTPTTKSALYKGPISISKTTTLKFIATDGDGNISPVKSETYTIDKVPPTVKSYDPKNSAVNVQATKVIKVTFSENIKAGGKSITLKNSAGKSITFTKSISGKVLTIKPKSKLAESKYKLTLSTGSITDNVGNQLKAKTMSFSVGTSPKVTKIDPKNNAKNVARGKKISIAFNENIFKGSKFSTIVLKNVKNGKTVKITKSISGKSLSIKHAKLAANTKYKLILNTKSITDKAGNPLKAKTFYFTTGRT